MSSDAFDGRYPHIRFQKHWSLDEPTRYMLGQCDALVQTIAAMPLQPAYRDALLRVSLIKGAQATTAIEGNTLTDAEVARVAEGQSLAPSKQYQEREVRNILDAMNGIFESVAGDGRAALITDSLIRDFHRQVGRDLGEHFDAIPGQFRTDSRVVGPYRCPRPEDVPALVEGLCAWSQREFGFASGRQTFADAVIQAIVTHVYLEWIHPFGDGNGRTGRLIEFYILLRAGSPDIASHILSNFYNLTRTEYYREIHRANKERDLSGFIRYAVQGYYDGLQECFKTISNSVLEVAWKYLVYSRFAEHRYLKKAVHKRQRDLVLSLPPTPVAIDGIPNLNTDLARQYAVVTPRTLLRDLDVAKEMGLVLKLGDGRYQANLAILGPHLSRRRILEPSGSAV